MIFSPDSPGPIAQLFRGIRIHLIFLGPPEERERNDEKCSWAAARNKGSYIQAQFRRIRSRRGAKKAIGAVAASILPAIYHMLKSGTCYQDLGPDDFDRRAKTRQTKRLVARLQNLGYAVQMTPVAA
jgi:transposase